LKAELIANGGIASNTDMHLLVDQLRQLQRP